MALTLQRLQQIAKEVQAQSTVTGSIAVMNGYVEGTCASGKNAIACDMSQIQHTPLYQLRGIIAHELGHFANGDVNLDPDDLQPAEVRQRESEADRYAVQIGFGKGLLAHLKANRADMIGADSGDAQHPATDTRIANIERWITGKP